MNPLRIGELAKRSRVNLETIRYYERLGLLPEPPRSPAGYRAFSPDAVRRIRFIKRAQELGFSLKEVQELLALRIDPKSPSARVRERAQAKISDIDGKIRNLSAMRKSLEHLITACSGRGSVGNCPILDSLDLDR